MKLFYDREMKKEIKGSIDFEKVEAGHEKYLSIWVFNDSDSAFLENVGLDIDDETIEIISKPKVIPPKSIGEIRIVWSPPMDYKQPLEAPVNITGYEVFYAKSKIEKMSKSPTSPSNGDVEHKIHCDICDLDWNEEQYSAHLKLHSEKDLMEERRKTKSELEGEEI